MIMSSRTLQVKRDRKKSFYLRELSALLTRLVQDEPTLLQLYFTRVELSADGGLCYVYCSFLNASGVDVGKVLFETAREKLVLYRGSMRKALASAASGKYVPDLRFFFDESKEKEKRVTDLLTKVGNELEEYDAKNSSAVHAEDDE